MMEQYYPEGFKPTTGGSIRIVPMERPAITLKYETLVEANKEFVVEVSIQDCTTFPLMVFVEAKSEDNSSVYALRATQENFATKFKAPSKSGTYKLNLKEEEENYYLFNNRDITVVDYICQ